jgi:hypothetical protein
MIATCRRQTLYILAAEEHIQSLEDNKMSSKFKTASNKEI